MSPILPVLILDSTLLSVLSQRPVSILHALAFLYRSRFAFHLGNTHHFSIFCSLACIAIRHRSLSHRSPLSMFIDSFACVVPSCAVMLHFLSLPPFEPEFELDPDPDEEPELEELLDVGALIVIVGRKTGMMGGFLGGCDIVRGSARWRFWVCSIVTVVRWWKSMLAGRFGCSTWKRCLCWCSHDDLFNFPGVCSPCTYCLADNATEWRCPKTLPVVEIVDRVFTEKKGVVNPV
ncbi:hypothetical protein B0T20DRAFT_123156 [Sordaria brevicollis]|uniref:Uncharacterized protein n=1 Tax=Sordaria brevicollis TaxID=83679 RepID=A0AAE0PKN5_SORBR|nr:hypothetical protein B0T20DRAFT_123156 [Sordaria brevicollis]